MKRPRRRSKTKSRAKAIKLSKEYWLRNNKEIKAYRDAELLEQDYRCAISFLPLDDSNSCLDHQHMCGDGLPQGDILTDGRVRGVLQRDLNLLEGKYLSYFKRMKLGERFNLNFADTLVNMGLYLQQDNSDKPLHYKFAADWRSYISKLTKVEILSKLKNEFGIEPDKTTLKRDLVRLFVQEWVDRLEESLDSK